MADKTIKGMRAPEVKALFKETVDNINQIKDALAVIEEQKKQASNTKIEISGDESSEGILGDIKKKQTEAEEKLVRIQEIHAELLGDDEDESDDGTKGELDALLEEFHTTQEKIKSAEKELYGHEEKTKEGEETHVEGLMEKIKKFFDLQKTKYTEIYGKIENELLAGATTVGLSKAYEDKANSYKKPNRIWLIGFFISIGIIVLILWLSLEEIEKLRTLTDQNLLEYFVIKLIMKIGIITSLAWVANFTGKRYNQNKRLAEEYSYKATFAKSFEGYRKRADELDQLDEDRNLSEKLMLNMIEMSAFNPVKTMESKSHKEKHPTMKILEKSINTIEKSVDVIDKMKK